MKIIITEKDKPIKIANQAHLDLLVLDVSEQVKEKNILSCILIEAENGNELNFVVGGEETVLGFRPGLGDPPYYVSKGEQDSINPLMTCYLLMEHHTEFPRKYVISLDKGLGAVHEFYETGNLPRCIAWQEI